MERVFNFSAGPAVLPESVLQQAAAEMLNYQGSGMSVYICGFCMVCACKVRKVLV